MVVHACGNTHTRVIIVVVTCLFASRGHIHMCLWTSTPSQMHIRERHCTSSGSFSEHGQSTLLCDIMPLTSHWRENWLSATSMLEYPMKDPTRSLSPQGLAYAISSNFWQTAWTPDAAYQGNESFWGNGDCGRIHMLAMVKPADILYRMICEVSAWHLVRSYSLAQTSTNLAIFLLMSRA